MSAPLDETNRSHRQAPSIQRYPQIPVLAPCPVDQSSVQVRSNPVSGFADRICLIQRIGFGWGRVAQRITVDWNQLKCWAVAMKHEETRAAAGSAHDLGKRGPQLLGVYRSIHVQLKIT